MKERWMSPSPDRLGNKLPYPLSGAEVGPDVGEGAVQEFASWRSSRASIERRQSAGLKSEGEYHLQGWRSCSFMLVLAASSPMLVIALRVAEEGASVSPPCQVEAPARPQ